jgi:hypothetical protein
MIGDLHVHTTRSDGSFSPNEAVFMAESRGLSYIGIVDHDTTEGLDGAVALGLRLGVVVVPGIEISAWDPARKRKAHLLGYRFYSPAPRIKALCDPLLEARDANTRRQVDILARAGWPITFEEVVTAAGPAKVLYKQHLLSVLVRKGVADGIYGSTYHELFGKGGLCAGDIAYVNVFEALRAIHEDGGLAVLAHPGQLDSWELMGELLEAGLDGVELYHESHSPEDHRKVLEAARLRPGLILTGGSDTHGTLGSEHSMGEIAAPPGALESLGVTPIHP